MLTQAQISEGEARLVEGKLEPVDVDSLVSVFQMFLAELEGKYGYEIREKLEELDDSEGDYKKAAQAAACLNVMESLGFGVARLAGDTLYKEKDEYFQYVVLAFSKIYAVPKEWSQYPSRRFGQSSSTILSNRLEQWD